MNFQIQPFRSIPINIAGPSYQDRSRPLASQITRNFYQEVSESTKEKYYIRSFPGQELLNAGPGPNADRGSHVMYNVIYRVVGNTLYRVTKAGVHTSLGEIVGKDRCIFEDDGVYLYVTTGDNVYQYDSEANVLSIVTSAPIKGAESVAFINNQFIYTFPTRSVFSDVGDGATASWTNSVNEETNPDDMVRDYVFNDIVYRCGERSIVGWYNTGVGTPPFEKITGHIMNVGLAGKYAITNTSQYLYWLADDRSIHRAIGQSEEVISSPAVSAEIAGYSDVSDCFSETFTIDDKHFVMFAFPGGNKTWCLIEELGKYGWFELTRGTQGDMFNASSIIDLDGIVYIGDRITGEFSRLDFDNYQINGNTWQRRRVIASVNGDLLGMKGKRVEMSRLELILETGTGLTQGQGKTPRIMIEPSYDGGRTWGVGTWMDTGRLGEFGIRALWDNMRSFYEMVVRITTSDPVAFNIYSGSIDLRLAGE